MSLGGLGETGVVRLGLTALLAAAATALCVASASARTDELGALFRQLMRDPGNLELNLRYAALSAEQGEFARAIAAYERILAEHPDNRTARQEIERLQRLVYPPHTELVASLGVQYESNSPRRDPSFLTFNDTVGTATLTMEDERVAGDRRWRTFGAAYASLHNRFETGDLGYFGVNTGPLVALGDGWTMRPAVGGVYATRDWQTMFAEGALIANFESRGTGALEEINLRFAGQDWTRRDPGKDALIGEATLAFRWRGIASTVDLASIRPVFLYNAAETAENTYATVGLWVSYSVPATAFGAEITSLLGQSQLVVEMLAERAKYDAPDRRLAPRSEDRRDYYIAPGARFVVPSLLGLNENWTLHYLFEDNISNEFINKYRNHTIGLMVSWGLL
jgi:hypothetical protein